MSQLPPDLVPNQFDPVLTAEEAYAACGPAAAVAFARANGRNPTIREALELAKEVGWTSQRGMAGPASQQKLLQNMGVPATLESGVNWAKVRTEVEAGNPVIISTPQHYFVATGYDAATDKFDFQASGTALKAGSRWLSPTQVESLGRGIQATLYLDTPAGKSAGASAPLRTEEPGPSMNPNIIVAVKDTEIKNPIAGLPSEEGQRVITLANGRTYTYRYGLDQPPADPAALEGSEFDPSNFSGLRQIASGFDAGRQAEWNRQNKPAAQQLKWITLPDGRKIAVNFDPTTGTTTPVTDESGTPIVSGPSGPTETEAQQAQRFASAKASQASAALSTARLGQVGRPAPQTQAQADLDIAKALEAMARIEVGIPAEAARDIAAARKSQADVRKLELEMLPKQLRLLQEAEQTIDYIHGALSAGTIRLDEANRYFDSVQSYVDAGLRGTTPSEEEKLRVEESTKRAQIGKDLLNRRVESGTKLAESAFSDYRELIQGMLVHPKGPQFNPFEYARLLTEELGGGPQASEMAQLLLAAVAPGGAGQMRPPPSGSLGIPPWMVSPATVAPEIVPEEPLFEEPPPEDELMGYYTGILGSLA